VPGRLETADEWIGRHRAFWLQRFGGLPAYLCEEPVTEPAFVRLVGAMRLVGEFGEVVPPERLVYTWPSGRRAMRVDAANEILIDRPAADVFAFVADSENDAAWRPGVLDITRVSGERPGVGARYRQGVKGPGGRRIDADIETTAYEPDRLIAFRTTAGPVRPVGRYEISPQNGATRVRFALEAERRGLKVAMAPAVRRAMAGEVGHLENLKRVLEERRP
jgi:uncharacterized protein YndB with AHSA1/START domain